jgi:hypothetical protein
MGQTARKIIAEITDAARARKPAPTNAAKSDDETNAPTHENWPINRIRFKCWLPFDLADCDIDWSPFRKMDGPPELTNQGNQHER